MKYYTFVWLLLLGYSLRGQTMTIHVSSPWTLPDHRHWNQVGPVLSYRDCFYIAETRLVKPWHLGLTDGVTWARFVIRIDQFDKGMEVRKMVPLGDSAVFGPFRPRLIVFGGKIWAFYYRMQNAKRVELWYSVVDPATLTVAPAKMLLSVNEQKRIRQGNIPEEAHGHMLRIGFSSDSSKMLLALWGIVRGVIALQLDKDGPIGQPRTSQFEGNGKDFELAQAQADNDGNGYFTYTYIHDSKRGSKGMFGRKQIQSAGVLVQTASDRDKWIHLDPVEEGQQFGAPHIHLSVDGNTIYVYGPYTAPGFEHGIFLTTLNHGTMALGPLQIFACPPDTTRKLQKMGYLVNKYGTAAANRAQYVFHQLSDGTIALTGYLVNTIAKRESGDIYIEYDAGPILNFFIKDGQSTVGVIYRDQPESDQSAIITIPYGRELICIYTDYADNIHSDHSRQYKENEEIGEPVLACAVITNAGRMAGREKLENTDGRLMFFMGEMQPQGNNTFLVPTRVSRTELIMQTRVGFFWTIISVK